MWAAWAINHLLSFLGPPSLLRLRPSGPVLGPSTPAIDASRGATVGPPPPPLPTPAVLLPVAEGFDREGASSSGRIETYVVVMEEEQG